MLPRLKTLLALFCDRFTRSSSFLVWLPAAAPLSRHRSGLGLDYGAAGGTKPNAPVPVSGHWGGRAASVRQENHNRHRIF